jgi:hypothetical protein
MLLHFNLYSLMKYLLLGGWVGGTAAGWVVAPMPPPPIPVMQHHLLAVAESLVSEP